MAQPSSSANHTRELLFWSIVVNTYSFFRIAVSAHIFPFFIAGVCELGNFDTKNEKI